MKTAQGAYPRGFSHAPRGVPAGFAAAAGPFGWSGMPAEMLLDNGPFGVNLDCAVFDALEDAAIIL